MEIESRLEALREWYANTARTLLEAEAPDRVAPLDDAFARLVVADAEELPICFLGAAGVGKSTLLNALIGGTHTIVPQGGVGPLTSQATLVRYGAQRRFRATYLPAKNLHQMLFALESKFAGELRRSDASPVEASALDSASSFADAPAVSDAGAEDNVLDLDALGIAAPTQNDAYLRQACLLIQGTQFPSHSPDPRYLIDAIRTALDRPLRWDTALAPDDLARIARLRGVLGASHIDVHADAELDAFIDALELHSCGHLAPMIATLEVWWDADLLRSGLVLVDLPGVGVANNEEHRKITADWVRRARAVVLVVDRAGVTEASVELLRTTGFLNSLLHDGDDDDARARLFVAAVKLDLSASDARSHDRDRRGDRAQTWRAHFDDVCARADTMLRGQLRTELERSWDDEGELVRGARRAVIERVLADLYVQAMSPLEYRRLARGDDDPPPLIKTLEQSRVPDFAQHLRAIGDAYRTRRAAAAVEQYQRNRERARGAIEMLIEQWESEARAESEVARLRDELLRTAAPLRQQLAVRHGQFREVLRNGISREIELQCQRAGNEARKELQRHLARFKDYPWQTVVASVKRGGVFAGARNIDLPNELTLRFEAPFAVAWSNKILIELRRRVFELTDAYASFGRELASWARALPISAAAIAALDHELAAHGHELRSVSDVAIDAVRQAVKQEIYRVVAAEVSQHCEAFVGRGLAQGRGVQARTLAAFEELADLVVDAARPAAQRVLEQNFQRIERQLTTVFERMPDPVGHAVDTLLAEQGIGAPERARTVVAQGRAALAALPSPWLLALPGEVAA